MSLSLRTEHIVQQAVDYIKSLDPDSVAMVTLDTYEDEDLNILVHTKMDSLELYQKTSRLTIDILVEEGLNIGIQYESKEMLEWYETHYPEGLVPPPERNGKSFAWNGSGRAKLSPSQA